MKRQKSKGPKTEPWGTPLVKGRKLDLLPFMQIDWLRLTKYDLNNLPADGVKL